jgi:hypothetical protein
MYSATSIKIVTNTPFTKNGRALNEIISEGSAISSISVLVACLLAKTCLNDFVTASKKPLLTVKNKSDRNMNKAPM